MKLNIKNKKLYNVLKWSCNNRSEKKNELNYILKDTINQLHKQNSEFQQFHEIKITILYGVQYVVCVEKQTNNFHFNLNLKKKTFTLCSMKVSKCADKQTTRTEHFHIFFWFLLLFFHGT